MAVPGAKLSLEKAKSRYHCHDIVHTDIKGTKVAHCTKISLGKGSFGQVYKGWREDGQHHIAVKIIEVSRLSYLAKEKLKREIEVMERLRGCDYVVQIFESMTHTKEEIVIITMELCDGDLHHLLHNDKKSFKEDEAILDFLHQLGKGMQELQKHDIVHRDIKPSNILIKKEDDKIVYKLADFGYARHFEKGQMLTSVAGTPIYMAPELLYVIVHPGEECYYDDKVDVWSIGALLYKVLVMKDAFPAFSPHQGYEILKQKKMDCIAFEMKSNKPVYISKLPSAVEKALSPPFFEIISELLVGMLQFDSKKRISFAKFFEKIEGIIELMMSSTLELINLLYGTSVKLRIDSSLDIKTLVSKASCTWNIPQEQVIIFSRFYPKYIRAHHQITAEEFTSLLEMSTGQDKCAVFYVFSQDYLNGDSIEPDVSCLEPLKSALDRNCADQLIINLELMCIMDCMEKQLYNQLESVTKLYQFTINETSTSVSYNDLMKTIHQTQGKVSVTLEVLKMDLKWCSDSNVTTHLQELTENLHKKERQLQAIEVEFDIENTSLLNLSFGQMELQKKIAELKRRVEEVQAATNMSAIHTNCSTIFENCKKLIEESTTGTKSKFAAVAAVKEISELLVRIQSARQEVFKGQSHSSSGRSAIEEFNQQLQEICTAGKQILQSKSRGAQSPSYHADQNKIDEELLMKVQGIVTQLCGNTAIDRKDHVHFTEVQSGTVVKITYPENYKAGDIVLLTPINTPNGSVPCILHLKWKNPHMLMDYRCLLPMKVKPGKVPQLFLGRLRETPQKYDLRDYPTTAHNIGQAEGFFYRVSIDPVSIKFLDSHDTLMRQEDQQQSVTSSRGRKSQK